jgi:hypothetical protein
MYCDFQGEGCNFLFSKNEIFTKVATSDLFRCKIIKDKIGDNIFDFRNF